MRPSAFVVCHGDGAQPSGPVSRPFSRKSTLPREFAERNPAVDLQQSMRLVQEGLVDDRRMGALDVLVAVLEFAEIGAAMEQADYWEQDFYPAAISRNHHNGLLGDQLPRVHYLDAAAFEALGGEVTWESLPVWG